VKASHYLIFLKLLQKISYEKGCYHLIIDLMLFERIKEKEKEEMGAL
jgi:hypothetical protein